ncbi:MAG: ABC transporter permease subunit [Paracoccaceae bacterium]
MQQDQTDAVHQFTERSGDYYPRVFAKIGQGTGWMASFNVAAFLLGPLWLGARALWLAFWLAFMAETFAVVLIGVGLVGDLGSTDILRAEQLTQQAAGRAAAAQTAADKGDALADSMRKSAEAIAAAAQKARDQAEASRGQAAGYVAFGALVLALVRGLTGLGGNALLALRYRQWRSNPARSHGLPMARIARVALLIASTYPLAIYRFSKGDVPDWLATFPAALDLRNALSLAIDGAVRWMADSFGLVFAAITRAVNVMLNLMETILVVTPWPIVMGVIITLAWQISGRRVAIFSIAALAYLGVLGFWEKSMATVALLGTAALLCVAIGVPLGVLCGRRPRVNAALRPVLDFMQTMPAFVYLIPVIAFFGIGKPPGVIATLIFGMPPVVRLTALGIAGVPPAVREAALAYGATPRFLLLKVDLPLAMPSIMTGINQTLLMCLSMVVIASLIGAKGLGEDVLSALQYAAVGQGILAGIAILMCAMVLDRIVQGQGR